MSEDPDSDAAGGGRDIAVPMELYKSITVFSTLFAVVFVLLAFVMFDAATLTPTVGVRYSQSSTLGRTTPRAKPPQPTTASRTSPSASVSQSRSRMSVNLSCMPERRRAVTKGWGRDRA